MSNDDVLFQRIGKVFPVGTIVCKEGETGNEMYVIQSGKVKITKVLGGEERVLATLGAGDFLGEMSILNNRPRSATAEVTEEAKVLVVEPKMFESMIRGNVEIAVRIIKTLAKRLQETDDQITRLMIKDANSRVIHTLAQMAENDGEAVDSGIKISTNQDDMVQKTGLDAEQVNEVLDKVVQRKLITVAADHIIVSDIEKLRKFLEFLTLKEQFGD